MNIIAEIFTVYAILLSLLFILVALIGVHNFIDEHRRRMLLYDNESAHSSEGTSIGISVIVSGYDSRQSIQQWLSIDYARYEVVLVCDFTQQPAATELLSLYALTRVNHSATGELTYFAPRALYRSKERRYNKLIVIDRHSTTLSDDFNCGTELCSHPYVIAMNRWSMLHNDALHRLSLEIQENAGRNICAVGGFRCSPLPAQRMAVIDLLVRMITLGSGVGSISGMGHYVGDTILFERESIVAAGGYKDDFTPDNELMGRIRTLWNRTTPRHHALLTPQILLNERGESHLTCNTISFKHPTSGLSLTSRTTVAVYCCLTLLFGITALIIGDTLCSTAFFMIIVVAYLSTIVVAVISLIAARIILFQSGFTGSIKRLWLTVFLYPFFALRCLLLPKNFVKS